MPQKHCSIHKDILQNLISTYSLEYSRCSRPLTCTTWIKIYASPHQRDHIFGSTGLARQHQWQGRGFVHPPTSQLATEAIQWARIVAQHTPNPRTDWLDMTIPYNATQTDIQLLAHFVPSQLRYQNSQTLLKYMNKQEDSQVMLTCIHQNKKNLDGAINKSSKTSLPNTCAPKLKHGTMNTK